MSFSPTQQLESMIVFLNIKEKPPQEYECYTFDKYDPPKDYASSGSTPITINVKSPKLTYHWQKALLAQQRLDTIKFQFRPETPEDGDCFLHAFLDQMSMDSDLDLEASNLTTVQLRIKIIQCLIESGKIHYDSQWQ